MFEDMDDFDGTDVFSEDDLTFHETVANMFTLDFRDPEAALEMLAKKINATEEYLRRKNTMRHHMLTNETIHEFRSEVLHLLHSLLGPLLTDMYSKYGKISDANVLFLLSGFVGAEEEKSDDDHDVI